jgi:opacity protein-like surface antigen
MNATCAAAAADSAAAAAAAAVVVTHVARGKTFRGIRNRGINKKKVGGPGKFSLGRAGSPDLGELTGIFAMQNDRKGA